MILSILLTHTNQHTQQRCTKVPYKREAYNFIDPTNQSHPIAPIQISTHNLDAQKRPTVGLFFVCIGLFWHMYKSTHTTKMHKRDPQTTHTYLCMLQHILVMWDFCVGLFFVCVGLFWHMFVVLRSTSWSCETFVSVSFSCVLVSFDTCTNQHSQQRRTKETHRRHTYAMGWLRLVIYMSLLQNIVSFIGLFCKRDL